MLSCTDGFSTISLQTLATELAGFLVLSRNHPIKIVHKLGTKGFIRASRAKDGSRLSSPAGEINIGQVVRRVEGHFCMAECSNPKKQGECILQPQCRLTGLLAVAATQCLDVSDDAVLSDLLFPKPVAVSL